MIFVNLQLKQFMEIHIGNRLSFLIGFVVLCSMYLDSFSFILFVLARVFVCDNRSVAVYTI